MGITVFLGFYVRDSLVTSHVKGIKSVGLF